MPTIQLKRINTRAPKKYDKAATKESLLQITQEIDDLQNLLYAENKHALLIVLQGMDASGKDGLIRNVFSYINPQGIRVESFKQPTSKELSHDFLWRIHQNTPAKGMIQVFNRSHYEDILVTRVHKLINDKVARQRMQAINDFESLLEIHNNTHILKFYLHISQEEQATRLAERLEDRTKQWKYNPNDTKEANNWDEYRKVYEECFETCNKVPWVIVPSDQNWYKEYVVATAVRDKLVSLKMEYPSLSNNTTH